MYLLIIILHKEQYLEDILSLFVELGIEDAAIIESQSLTRALASDVPIFAGLRFQMEGSKKYSKVILALTDNPDIGDELVSILKDEDIDFDKPGTGRIVLLKTEKVFGKPEEVEI